MFFSKRRSWLDGLYERSYRMKMGEVHLPGVDLYMVNEPALVHQVMDHAEAFPKHEMLGEALRPCWATASSPPTARCGSGSAR
jgi:hypothetical protein